VFMLVLVTVSFTLDFCLKTFIGLPELLRQIPAIADL
jgi:hypothetical protein